MSSFHDKWGEYRQQTIAMDAGQRQVEQLRQTFYAGAIALFALINDLLDPDREPTLEDVQKIQKLHDELFIEFPMTLPSNRKDCGHA